MLTISYYSISSYLFNLQKRTKYGYIPLIIDRDISGFGLYNFGLS